MRIAITLDGEATLGGVANSRSSVPTLQYIPGSVVRGAYSAAWIREHGAPNDQFDRLFEGPIRFGPLFAGAPPLPLSILTHKRRHDPHRCQRAWWDLALETPAQLNVCPDCAGPLEMSKGKIVAGPTRRSVTHVALGPGETALDGKLYTREVIAGDTEFTGELDGPADLIAELAEYSRLRIGGRLTTNGAASAVLTDAEPTGVAQRLDDGRLLLRLASPAVFVDERGRPRREPTPGELGDLLGYGAAVERSWTRWTTVGGWHIASGLPKPVDRAVEAGSTFVVKAVEGVDDDALRALAQRGLGLRRHEGFGALAPPPCTVRTAAALNAEVERHLGRFVPLRGIKNPAAFAAVVTALRELAEARRHTPAAQPLTDSILVRFMASQAPENYRKACAFLVGVTDPDLLGACVTRMEQAQ
jgi:CRISPR-associated protein Csx10